MYIGNAISIKSECNGYDYLDCKWALAVFVSFPDSYKVVKLHEFS